MLLRKLHSLYLSMCRRWGMDANEDVFVVAARLSSEKSGRPCTTSPARRILVQMPQDYFYLCLFFVTARALAGADCQITGLWHQNVMSAPRGENFQALRRLLRRVINRLDRRKWQHLYRAVGARDFVSLEVSPWRTFHHWLKAWRIWRGLHCKRDLLNLSLNGTPCGDLIYDTYLRYRVQPTVDLTDPYLRTLIAQALNAQAAFRRRLADCPFDCFLSSYSAYIQHGIPVREAIRANVTVYTAGNLSQYYKKLSNEDALHTTAHWKYKDQFLSLPSPDAALALAREQLENRFRGGIDQATQYMKTSAYAVSSDVMPADIEGVVFLHDFFDSPHCHRHMLFEDFWEWAIFTLDVIQSEGLPIAIKPHPNQLPESRRVVEQLKHLYPDIRWLDPKLSNRTIFRSGILCGISVYGTILHELAYHGISALAAGDHPHVAFDIAITPKSIAEYREHLIGFRNLGLSGNVKNEVLAFYYMHNQFNKEGLNIDLDSMNLRALDPNDSAALPAFVATYQALREG